MTTYRAGVIGLGRMGSTFDDEITQGGSLFLPYCHGPTYHAAPNVELVSGADLHAEQASIFGERWGIVSEHIYGDYREMLEKEKSGHRQCLHDGTGAFDYRARCGALQCQSDLGRKTDFAQSRRGG